MKYFYTVLCFFFCMLLFISCSGDTTPSSSRTSAHSGSQQNSISSSALDSAPSAFPFLEEQYLHEVDLPAFDSSTGFISMDGMEDICYLGYLAAYNESYKQYPDRSEVYYFNGEKNELIGTTLQPQDHSSYDYVSMPDGTFYAIYSNQAGSDHYSLVEINAKQKIVKETPFDFGEYRHINPLFYYEELNENAFAIWIKHADLEQNIFYHEIVKYDIPTGTFTPLLHFVTDRSNGDPPENTVYPYGISADENYLYVLTGVQKEYAIQQYDHNGTFLKEYSIPNLYEDTSGDTLWYFDHAENTFFIGSISTFFGIYQLQEETIVRHPFRAKYGDSHLSMVDNKLLYNGNSPYVYIRASGKEADEFLYIFDLQTNHVYQLGLERKDQNSSSHLFSDRAGNILLQRSSLDKLEDMYYFIHAEDIIANMQPYFTN